VRSGSGLGEVVAEGLRKEGGEVELAFAGTGDEGVELLEGQGDGKAAQELVLHPLGDGMDLALPFVDGAGGGIAQLEGQGFAGEVAGEAELAQFRAGHDRQGSGARGWE
jgi:hypothetical protein